MKKLLTSALILGLVLSLAACGGSGGAPTATLAPSPSAASATAGAVQSTTGIDDEDYEQMMSGLGQLTGDDERLGTEYYRFPAVIKFTELPDPDVWTQMGMIDLTPTGCESGRIYDDGTVLLEGFWNGFSIECDSSEEAYHELCQRIWDAGYRGIPVGNGVIAPAESMEDVYDAFDQRYGAFYEHDGWLLFVEANFYSWDDSILCGVVDAKTMTGDYENLIRWPRIDWSVTRAGAPKNGLDALGSDFCGVWGEHQVTGYSGSYTATDYLVYAGGVSRADFEAYTDALSRREDVYVEADWYEDLWENWSIYYETSNAQGFRYVALGYCESASMVYWRWELE